MRACLPLHKLSLLITCFVVVLSLPQKAYPCIVPDPTSIPLYGLERIPVEGTLALTPHDPSEIHAASTTIEVKDPGGIVVPGTLRDDESRRLLIWQAENTLAASTTYQASITVPRLGDQFTRSFTFTTAAGPQAAIAAPNATLALLKEQEFNTISACCNTSQYSCPPECEGVEYGYRNVLEVHWNFPTELLSRYYDISWEQVDSNGQTHAAESTTDDGNNPHSIVRVQELGDQPSEYCVRLKLTRWMDGATTTLAQSALVKEGGIVCLSADTLETIERKRAKPDLDSCMDPVIFYNEQGEVVPYVLSADEGGGCSVSDRNSRAHLWIGLILIVSLLIYIHRRYNNREKKPHREI